MDPATDAAIRSGLCACFPNDIAIFSQTRAWHGSGPAFCVLMEAGGEAVAHTGVVDRTIRVGADRLRIAGVQNVFVLPRHRGRGLVDQAMRMSMEEAERRRMDAGLLFCIPALEKLYARTGWQTLSPRPVWATRSGGERYRLDEKNILMFHPLLHHAFPEGEIDLNGDDW
jgi:hypothetical protein